jgi:ADP-L-glycero-D-manno-heptose 6-epimerase
MKVLVTGASGFIGQNMVSGLREEHEVIPHEWGQTISKVNEVDWVIHLGAISSTVEQNVAKIYKQNLDFSINLYEECIKNKVNFQFASSASVYGLKSSFEESAPLNPQNHYSRSKAMFEKYIELRKAPIITQTFRYFNVYGPHEDHKGGQASPHTQFTKQAKESGLIKLFEGSENYKRDFIHVAQIVDYHKRFFSVEESGVWNMGTGVAKSFYDVAKEIANEHGAGIEYIKMPDILKDNYQEFTEANTRKLHTTLSE